MRDISRVIVFNYEIDILCGISGLLVSLLSLLNPIVEMNLSTQVFVPHLGAVRQPAFNLIVIFKR